VDYEVWYQNVLSIKADVKVKGKAIPLQAWTGREDSRRLRNPDLKTIGGKVFSSTHRPPLTPRKYFWYLFLLEAESTPGP
jgi:hypothetical protein